MAPELTGTDEDARKNLSKAVVGIIQESVPGFGAPPKTPLEEVLAAAEKLKK